ncbi:Putative carbohydrate sulfotransferase [Chondrus crispus]|uniref:Putative carbohydrate sulfotransferase n=1 Tax=Chondrus crispus TaxID=2769 RepID=R7QIL9_CHOCR|nr:Putative carbohydrate sulfotransferase [Chondrus crispus]CDF37265.1 Putative carbohydrate sulfotransferase [Chondrus crispus]|eukprot:XP_005717084.1 Putative carbohydrate sulfotransferase [Chondrus crispus]
MIWMPFWNAFMSHYGEPNKKGNPPLLWPGRGAVAADNKWSEASLTSTKPEPSKERRPLSHRDYNLTFAVWTAQMMYAVQTPDLRVVSCVPPKNGCTYHRSLLRRISGNEDFDRVYAIHNLTWRLEMALSTLREEQIEDILENDEVPKYILTRNPITRTLSGYLNMVHNRLPIEKRTVTHFEDWIRQEFSDGRLTQEGRIEMNPHWMPQSKLCGVEYGIHKYFRLLKFEEPVSVITFIYDHVPRKFLDDGWGRKDKVNVSFSNYMLGPRNRTEGTSEKLLTYFRSLDTFDHLAGQLSLDIDELGYRKEVTEMRNLLVNRDKNSQGRGLVG